MLNHEFFHTKWDLVEMHKRVCRNYVSLPPSFPVSFSFSFVWLIYMWTEEVLHWVGVGEGAAYRRPLTAHCRGADGLYCAEDQNCASSLYKVQITFSKIAKLVWLCVAASQQQSTSSGEMGCLKRHWDGQSPNEPTDPTFSSSKLNF